MGDDSILIIRIPVNESVAWELFRENWYQIDAPRHCFIFSERSLKMLMEQEGLTIFDSYYDSLSSQFYISKMYRDTDLSLSDINKLEDPFKKEHVKLARKANVNHKGDMATFYIRLQH